MKRQTSFWDVVRNEPCCPWCGQHRDRRYIGGHIQGGRARRKYALNEYRRIRLPNGKVSKYKSLVRTGLVHSVRLAEKRIKIEHASGTCIRVRRGKSKPIRSLGAGRTYVFCAHPFHTAVIPAPKVIPARVHNPDLAEMKRSLKRQLQGKDRR